LKYRFSKGNRAPRLQLSAFVIAISLVAIASTGHAQPADTISAAPQGRGTYCTHSRPCLLQTAVDRARAMAPQMQQDITVELEPGRYRLHQSLVLTQKDSGQHGHLIRWQGTSQGQAILDGGIRIRGWVQADRKRNLWRANLPPDSYGLQLFVDGVRAVRARRRGCENPAECRYTERGLTGFGHELQGLSHPEDVVAVFAVRWRDFHCGVEKLDGDDIVMRQPCWRNTVIDSVKNGWSNASPKGKPFKGVDWFENAYEFLGTPGQFYIDSRKHVIYYTPRHNEDMHTADVEMPIVEHLLLVEGTPHDHVHDIEFRHIGFEHAAWNLQEHSDGYVPLQGGYLVTGIRKDLPHNGEGMWRLPAAVEVSGGSHIRFVDDRISALGAAGITLASGTRNSSIEQCVFNDLSGGAIFIGDIVANPTDPLERSAEITISRNTITNIAVEYRDNVAIMGGFNDALTIDHNTISELPYTGISVGWGWNYEGSGDVQRNIHIRSNRISHFMLTLHDGGAIYTQAQSPGSDVTENYIDFGGTPDGNGIYLDERSRGYSVCGNVVWNVPEKMPEGQWVSAWSSWSGDLKIHNNWSDDTHTSLHNPGPTKEFRDNQLALKTLPQLSKKVIDASGVSGPNLPVTDCLNH
jgi:Right handed beta helix region